MCMRKSSFDASKADSYGSAAGWATHRYASVADPWVRQAVDLTALSSDQLGWLMSLPERELRRLSAAGPTACDLAVRGVEPDGEAVPVLGRPGAAPARLGWLCVALLLDAVRIVAAKLRRHLAHR